MPDPVYISGLKSCWVVDPMGRTYIPTSVAFSNAVNRGISWSMEVDGFIRPYWNTVAHTGDTTTVYATGSGSGAPGTITTAVTPNVSYPAWDRGWTLYAATEQGLYTSPPLHVLQIDPQITSKGKSTTLTGTDLASWLLSVQGVSQQTFVDQTVASVLNYTAILANCPSSQYRVRFVGAPNIQIFEYDLKGGTFKSHAERLLSDMGYNYRVSPVTSSNYADITCFAADHVFDVAHTTYIAEYAEHFHLESQVDVIRFRKNSKLRDQFILTATTDGIQHSEFPNALYVTSATDISVNGHPAYLQTYTGTGEAGAYAGFWRWGTLVPVPGGQTFAAALSAAWSVVAPNNRLSILSRILVQGHVPNAGRYDFTFEIQYPYQVPVLSAFNIPPIYPISRLNIVVIESPVWPTKEFVEGIVQRKWWDIQKSYQEIDIKLSRFDPFWLPGEKWPARAGYNDKDGRIEVNSWRMTPQGTEQTLHGYIPRDLPENAYFYVVPFPT